MTIIIKLSKPINMHNFLFKQRGGFGFQGDGNGNGKLETAGFCGNGNDIKDLSLQDLRLKGCELCYLFIYHEEE